MYSIASVVGCEPLLIECELTLFQIVNDKYKPVISQPPTIYFYHNLSLQYLLLENGNRKSA